MAIKKENQVCFILLLLTNKLLSFFECLSFTNLPLILKLRKMNTVILILLFVYANFTDVRLSSKRYIDLFNIKKHTWASLFHILSNILFIIWLFMTLLK